MRQWYESGEREWCESRKCESGELESCVREWGERVGSEKVGRGSEWCEKVGRENVGKVR